ERYADGTGSPSKRSKKAIQLTRTAEPASTTTNKPSARRRNRNPAITSSRHNPSRPRSDTSGKLLPGMRPTGAYSAAVARIVVIHPSDDMYGIDRVGLEIARTLAAAGHE